MQKMNGDSHQILIQVIYCLIFLEYLDITKQIFFGTWLQALKLESGFY